MSQTKPLTEITTAGVREIAKRSGASRVAVLQRLLSLPVRGGAGRSVDTVLRDLGITPTRIAPFSAPEEGPITPRVARLADEPIEGGK